MCSSDKDPQSDSTQNTQVQTDGTGSTNANRGIGFPRFYEFLLLVLTRGRERAYRNDMLEVAGIAPGDHVLDIGCGTGTLAVAAWRRSQPGGSVAGTDISEKMLGVARRKARRAGANIYFHHGDAALLPFEDEQFDVATITTVMHALPEPQRKQCLGEAKRVLKRGGRLVIIDFSGDPEKRTHWAAKHGPHGEFDLDCMRAPLSQAGFHHLERGALNWLDLGFLKGTK